jgi:hypothetical protein
MGRPGALTRTPSLPKKVLRSHSRMNKVGQTSDVLSDNQYDSLADNESDPSSIASTRSTRRKSSTKRLSTENSQKPKENVRSAKNYLSKPKSSHPKPIIIKSSNTVTQQKLSSLKLSERPACKILQGGQIKIFPKSAEDKEAIVQNLKSSKIEHFTYTESSDRHNMFVMKGYDNVPSEDLMSILLNEKIEVKKVHTIYKRDDFAVFLITFEKDKITLSKLQTSHNVINFLRVKWETYNNKKKRPTQCRNCQRWGHSSLNCGFKNRCVKCLEDHELGNCSRKDKSEPLENLHCVNCRKSGHPANSATCEAFLKYKEMINSQSKNVRHPRKFNFNAAPWTIENEDFPKLPNPPKIPNPSTSQSETQNSQGESYRSVLSKLDSNPQQTQYEKISQFTNESSDDLNQEIREVLQTFSEIVKKLRTLPDKKARLDFLLVNFEIFV